MNGMKIIIKINGWRNKITVFNIWYNNIGDNGAFKLAEALKTNKILTYIDLNNNNIGSKGPNALTKLLKTNSTLTTLEFIANNIGDDKAIALAEALKNNSTLVTLELRYNKINVEDTKALSNALKNSTLTKLLLDFNMFVSTNKEDIKELISNHRKHIYIPNKTLEIDLFWKWNNGIME